MTITMFFNPLIPYDNQAKLAIMGGILRREIKKR